MIGNGQLEGLAECELFVDAEAGCRADNGDREHGTRQSGNPIVDCGMRSAACAFVHGVRWVRRVDSRPQPEPAVLYS